MDRRQQHGHTHSRDHDHGHDHDHDHHHDHGGPGHNRSSERPAAQWQTPHSPGQQPPATAEADLDKVEAAFIDGFIDAPDPVSFLRLGRIPFELIAADGATLNLLRVEIDALADVAVAVNSTVENIGARRLQTVMERVLDEISFTAPDRHGETIRIDAEYVQKHVGDLAKNTDLSRFIL